MTDGNERRRHKRVGVTWTAQTVEGTSLPATVEIVNISISGLALVSLTPMQPTERYRFRLQGWVEAPIEGVVRWSDVGDVRTYAGIEFVAPTQAQLGALRALIERYDAEDWGR